MKATLWPILALAGCVIGWTAAAGPSRLWSPYEVGAGIGVLSWLTFYFSNKPIGASSFYANVAGLLGRLAVPGHTARLKYFQENPPQLLNWGTLFVVASVAGAYLAATTAGDFEGRWLSPMWEARFGADSLGLRLAVALAGGILMAFGARLAGGCTSGHGISGTMQLAVSSWLTVVALFASGVVTALSLYGGL